MLPTLLGPRFKFLLWPQDLCTLTHFLSSLMPPSFHLLCPVSAALTFLRFLVGLATSQQRVAAFAAPFSGTPHLYPLGLMNTPHPLSTCLPGGLLQPITWAAAPQEAPLATPLLLAHLLLGSLPVLHRHHASFIHLCIPCFHHRPETPLSVQEVFPE